MSNTRAPPGFKVDTFPSFPIYKMGFINLFCDTFTSALSCSRIEHPQCEANADTEIVYTAVGRLHLNKTVLTKAGVSAKTLRTDLI